MLVVTAMLLVFGRLSDVFGTKLVFILGMVVFTISSGLCAFSPSISYLIGFRALQGFGAAMIMSNTPVIVTNAFPPEKRGMGLGAIGGIVSVGLMLGPPLGGIIIHYLGWHFIFIVNIPVGILGILLSLKILPSRDKKISKKFSEVIDALLWVGGITSYVLIFGIAGKGGMSWIEAIGYASITLIIFIYFFSRQLKNDSGFLGADLLKNKIFMLSSSAGLFTYMGMIGVSFMMPFLLENSFGLDPLQTGRLLMVVPATTFIISPLSGFLSDKLGQRPVSVVGSIIMSISVFSFMGLTSESSLLRIGINLSGMGIGMGMFGSPNNSALMGSVSPKNRGSASGILATVRNLGMVTGLGMISLIYNSAIQKSSLNDISKYASAFKDTMPIIIIISIIAIIFTSLRKSVRGTN
jgi:EmrB/QacA subfamily drug resistance transporter